MPDHSAFGDIVVHEMGQPSRVDRLRGVLRTVRRGGPSLQEAFLESPTVSARIQQELASLDVDLEVIDTVRMIQHVRSVRPRGRRILYLDDLFSVRYRRMLELSPTEAAQTDFDPLGQFADHVPGPLRRLTTIDWSRRRLLSLEAARIGSSEIRAAKESTLSLLLNPHEAAALRRATGARVESIPPSVPALGGTARPWHGRPEYVFVGLLSVAHNHDGLTWFLRSGMPKLLRYQPDAVLHVLGRGASPVLRAAAEPYGDHVRIHGYVADLDDAIGDACALVNTLRFGSGVKIKTLEALSRGIPVVSTWFGAEGIASRTRPGLTVVNDAAAAGLALARLADPDVRGPESAGALALFESRFSAPVVAPAYDAVFGTRTVDAPISLLADAPGTNGSLVGVSASAPVGPSTSPEFPDVASRP
jgi:glycosyltransferase involved in cell wall biosynthesis